MKSGLFNVALEVLVREKEKEEKKGRETGGGGGGGGGEEIKVRHLEFQVVQFYLHKIQTNL